ncbi:Septal ring factor EnvC, activator of murein hydrolases AmiA and AmiB [Hydrobacter penzbergensis]|uniref:Septal ring factor EnvC, activator of murein hydrolases AmiA and AmiB n=1 Tax=Hydrobacter penzbergensis TaxID=1235997 RepID=A0A8X8LEY0_9BACT|nr:peptidoglycan DD-metalloendopeptidase family protein [Hydrobacter penzbergensis]SDW84340.1 Septal ring factor EnvC, activator of murein hydrolases AmiA and AmiB [Hydrobacter penzbergensis]
MMKRLLTVFLLLGLATGCAYAQTTREELQKKEQDLKKELADLNRQQLEIQKNKKLSLSQLAIIKRKVKAREELVNSISKQIRALDETIFTNERDIYRLGKELDTLKLKYAKSVVFAYKSRGGYEYLNFLFSANSFNDAVKRITYLKSYRQNREAQANAIVKSDQLLHEKIGQLNNNKKEQVVTLQKQSDQLKALQEDRRDQDQVVAQLKGKEKEIGKQIHDKERQRQKMREAILAVIRRETEEAARRERVARLKAAEDAKKAAAAGTPKEAEPKNNTATATVKPKATESKVADAPARDRVYTPLESTPEGRETSIKFENNKGHLPWPVDVGNIEAHFGVETIPGTKLTRKTDGIEISLPQGSTVRSIADGEVSYAGEVQGEATVFLRHGKYFSIYSHLSTIFVSRGQQVKAGSVLGRSGTNIDGEGALLLMINNEKNTPLDPEQWLKRRR